MFAEAVIEAGVEVWGNENGHAGEAGEEEVGELVENRGVDVGDCYGCSRREGADVDHWRGDARAELERERVGIEGEGEAGRGTGVRGGAEREEMGDNDAPRHRSGRSRGVGAQDAGERHHAG